MLVPYLYYGDGADLGHHDGVIGGLVGITACCNVVSIPAAVLLGAVSGLIFFFGLRLLERLRMTTPSGPSPAHAFCGVWGTLAVGLLGDGEAWAPGLDRGSRSRQLRDPAAFAWTFGVSYPFLRLVDASSPSA